LVAIVDVTSIRLERAVEGEVDVAVQSGGFCVDDLGCPVGEEGATREVARLHSPSWSGVVLKPRKKGGQRRGRIRSDVRYQKGGVV